MMVHRINVETFVIKKLSLMIGFESSIKKMEAYLVQETSDWNLQQANILYLLILMIRYMRDL